MGQYLGITLGFEIGKIRIITVRFVCADSSWHQFSIFTDKNVLSFPVLEGHLLEVRIITQRICSFLIFIDTAKLPPTEDATVYTPFTKTVNDFPNAGQQGVIKSWHPDK